MTRVQDIDAGWVRDKRAANVSWSAIARMAGCSEHDLRKRLDAGFTPLDLTPSVPATMTPRDQVRAALKKRGLSDDHALVIARLWLANGARKRSTELTAGIAGGGAAQSVCAEAKRDARRIGVTFAPGPMGLALTPEAVGLLSEMAGLPRGRP
jgi:hypothetical protein